MRSTVLFFFFALAAVSECTIYWNQAQGGPPTPSREASRIVAQQLTQIKMAYRNGDKKMLKRLIEDSTYVELKPADFIYINNIGECYILPDESVKGQVIYHHVVTVQYDIVLETSEKSPTGFVVTFMLDTAKNPSG